MKNPSIQDLTFEQRAELCEALSSAQRYAANIKQIKEYIRGSEHLITEQHACIRNNMATLAEDLKLYNQALEIIRRLT